MGVETTRQLRLHQVNTNNRDVTYINPFTFIYMKKTQKILDILKYIEALNLTCDELDRLTSEVEDLKGSDYEDELEDIGDDSDSLREFNS